MEERVSLHTIPMGCLLTEKFALCRLTLSVMLLQEWYVRFTLKCLYMQGSPVFVTEPEPLKYVFQWQTQAACPPCSFKTDCGSCTDNGCVWCNDNSTCSSEIGICNNFVSDHYYCPVDQCNKLTSCVDYTVKSFGECGWCLDQKTCVGQKDECRNLVKNVEYCPFSKVKIN